jgi:hypothetical protein
MHQNFHLHADHRCHKKIIVQLTLDGVLVLDQDEKANDVDSIYGKLWSSSPECGLTMDFDFLGMKSHDLSILGVPFTKEEVWGIT